MSKSLPGDSSNISQTALAAWASKTNRVIAADSDATVPAAASSTSAD
jgi:hypothetical protein